MTSPGSQPPLPQSPHIPDSRHQHGGDRRVEAPCACSSNLPRLHSHKPKVDPKVDIGPCFCRFDRLQNIPKTPKARDTDEMVSIIGANRQVPAPNFARPVVHSSRTNKKNASEKQTAKRADSRKKHPVYPTEPSEPPNSRFVNYPTPDFWTSRDQA